MDPHMARQATRLRVHLRSASLCRQPGPGRPARALPVGATGACPTAWIAQAAAERLARERLAAAIADYEADAGPVTDVDMAERSSA